MTCCFETDCKNSAPVSQANVCSKCIEYYCNECITKTPEKSYCRTHRKMYGITETTLKERGEEKMAPILKLIREKNIEELNKLEVVPSRMLIKRLKNELEDLDFFLGWLSKWSGGMLPGAGSYHYTKIKDNRTFDIYKKHGFDACNLFPDVVTPEQWKYLVEIGYITQESENDDE